LKDLIKNYFGIQTIEFMKLLKYGRIEFYKGLRKKNKKKAVNFINKLKKKGFIEYNLYFNDYGYIIKFD
jgi:hypothetical protein